MSIIKWQPFAEIDSLADDFFSDNFIPVVAGANNKIYPPINLYEDKDNLFVEASLSGVDPSNVSVDVENNVLTIKGKIEKIQEIDEVNYYKKEIRRGDFSRQISLPVEVNTEKINADYKDGILKITLPKKDEIKPKKIEVKINKK